MNKNFFSITAVFTIKNVCSLDKIYYQLKRNSKNTTLNHNSLKKRLNAIKYSLLKIFFFFIKKINK